jgi:adenine-specific DNA-methyltransferase
MFYYFYFDREKNKLTVSKEKKDISNLIEIFPLREDGVEGRWRWGFETAQKQFRQTKSKTNAKPWDLGSF